MVFLRRLFRHLCILLPLGLATGAIVGALFRDLFFGLIAGAGFSILWGAFLSFFQHLSGVRVKKEWRIRRLLRR